MRPLAAAAALLLAPSVFAAEPPKKAPAKPPRPCAEAVHRQFDFWVGSWEVKDAKGKVVGHNKIESILGGCALRESWKSTSGRSVGHSFNAVGPDRRWHQTWVDNQGTLLRLSGGLDARGRMVMSETVTTAAGTVVHEIAWTPRPDGTVEQRWRTSKDGGKTYADAFLGVYHRQDGG